MEERRSGKRPRFEAPPGPSAKETLPSPPLIPWIPDIEGALGRLLAVTDRAGGSPYVVAALGRACALPLDMAKSVSMDNESLLLSSMRSLVQVMLLTFLSCFDFDVSLLILISVLQLMQKCQIGMERMEAAEARAAGWVAERADLQAERERLQKALEAKTSC